MSRWAEDRVPRNGSHVLPALVQSGSRRPHHRLSPLGLVELADEEFEVHGPRLNRYANNWAWYLGHHWATARAVSRN